MSQEFVGPLTVTSALGVQGGSLELGATLGAAPETPYVGFHFGLGAAQDYNVRLLNAADNRLDVVTASGGPVLSIQGDKIGIGTTTPAAKLVVNELAGGAELRVDGLNGTVGLSLGADAAQPWVGTRTNHALRLRGVFFEWKEPEQQGNLTGPQMGLMADEVEEVFPEWISTDPEGYKQLTVRGFEALVVEALRTLKAENDHSKVQNQALETRVVGLEAKLQTSVLMNDGHNNGAAR